jgi:hypothetical protein
MRQHQQNTPSKLLTVLFVFLVLPMSIFMVQYAQGVQGASSSIKYPIYEGSLAPGWVNWSWMSRVNLANPSPVYAGTPSIAFTPTQIGAGLYLHTNTVVDISPYTFLHFAARASRTGQDYNVMLYDGANHGLPKVRLAHYGGNPVRGSWKVYTLPLSDLRANATQISGVALQSRTRRHGTLYLASISFTSAVSSPTPTPTLTSTADPTASATSTADPTGTATSTADPTATATADPTGKFTTLPPGSALPSESACAARVRPSSWEPRPDNEAANHTNVYAQGHRLTGSYLAQYGYESRVTGNFSGTTDEIIQWAACKWGFDEDTVRAQAVQESSWHQSQLGDCNVTTQPQTHGCSSVGILQVKGADIPPTHPGTWPYASQSTAFNLDYTLAVRRACFEGKETWLGNGYHAGDIWGCLGRWYSGRWYDQGAVNYIQSVQALYTNKVWLRPGF